MRLLWERAGQPVTRDEILEKIWGVPGHAEHPHRRQLHRQAAQEDRGRRRQARATSSRSTGPATSWWCDGRDRPNAGARARGRRRGRRVAAGRAARRLRALPVLRRCAARTATSRSTRAPRFPTTPTPTPSSPRSRPARRWFDGAGPLVSIYFGGGTPGLWRADALGRVIAAARGGVRGPPGADALEITVEVNPGETDEAQLRALRAPGRQPAVDRRAGVRRSVAARARPQSRRGGRAGLRAGRARGRVRQPVDRSDVRRAGADGRRLAAGRRRRDRARRPSTCRPTR